MGQKVSPVGLRVGVINDWSSRWFATKKDYAKWLHQDICIRATIKKLTKNAQVSKVDIEQTKKNITIYIKTSRPGMILGQEGKNKKTIIIAIQKALKNRKIDIKLNIIQVKEPNADAQIIANTIAKQLVNRDSFRIVQKLAIRKALRAGAKGVKTSVAGRLGGVEIARTEGYLEGSMPFATLRSDIDYAFAEALTTYGQIGVKVWICKGDILDVAKHRLTSANSYKSKPQSHHNQRSNYRNSPNQSRNFRPRINNSQQRGNINVNAKKG